jgi:hypothetical protein
MCIGVLFGVRVVVLVEFAEYAPKSVAAVLPAGDEGGAEDPEHGADRDDGGEVVGVEQPGVVVRGGRYAVPPDGRHDAGPAVCRYGVYGVR